jgi:ComF family protein
MNYISTFFSSLAHLVYPHVCAGCGSDLVSHDQLLCLDCIDDLPVTNFYLHASNPVEKIFWGRLSLVTATSYTYFTKQSVMQSLLHQFKYKGKKEIGLYFGKRMGDLFRMSNRYNDIEALIPLPLFFQKERKRGYNQAAVICEGISERMEVPVWKDIVTRNKRTETQTHMNRTERWANIEGKFEVVNEKCAEGKHVLLVDDVLTTGATLEACGAELQKIKGLRLSIATLAYTSL